MALIVFTLSDTSDGVSCNMVGEPDLSTLQINVTPLTPAQQAALSMLDALKFNQENGHVEAKSKIILAGSDEAPL